MALLHLTDINLNKNALQFASLHPLTDASSLTTPATGQVYYDTTDSVVKAYDGSAWNILDSIASANLTGTTLHLVKDSGLSDVTVDLGTLHPTISAASSVDNSGRTYIQDIALDSNGHVTGIVSATETVVDTDTTYSIGSGATTIIMEKFDPLSYLENVEKYKVTHSQLVPTMFSRMLKLPEDERNKYDLSSLEYAIHAAAPCPEIVKRQMIDWWGPIIYEYYGATEAFGFAACNTQEWLEHPGTVGKIVIGELSILDDNMEPLPNGEPGTLWFKPASKFAYHNDSDKTKEATSEDGKLTTVGDVGYVDEDGYLYLTDRKAFMIISGGVNIYPQECEDLLIAHPKIFDAAVFGVPNVDLGEEVKAVVQTVEGVNASEDLTVEILEYLSEHLSRQKIPRSIDYKDELPRLPTGKLYKRLLRDEYWGDGKNKIIKE